MQSVTCRPTLHLAIRGYPCDDDDETCDVGDDTGASLQRPLASAAAAAAPLVRGFESAGCFVDYVPDDIIMHSKTAPLPCSPNCCNSGMNPGLSLCVHHRQLRTAIGHISFYDAVKTNAQAASLVALVSLALSIGLGIASGSTPIAGLRTAIWGGIACGIFGSSPFNIIGPAGALSGMLNTYSAKWGADILPWIAIISGGFCLIFVRLRLTRYCLFMPKSVFEGFTLSVALTIGFKQINYAFGLSGLKPHVEFLDNLWESLSHLNEAQWGSMVLFFPLTIALLLLMKHYPKVPWMVLLPLLSIFFGFFFREKDSGWYLPTLRTKFGDLPSSIAVLPDPKALQKLSSSDIGGLILAGLTVAFVSVLETLISAKIAENKTTAQVACL
jgi:MFS superfamily sulfate permease-like transporter